MKVSVVIFTLLLLISGCSSVTKYSPLTDLQQQKLHTYRLNNTFISGCVDEKIATINRDYCDKENSFCNIPPESSFNIEQWLAVYQACVVK